MATKYTHTVDPKSVLASASDPAVRAAIRSPTRPPEADEDPWEDYECGGPHPSDAGDIGGGYQPDHAALSELTPAQRKRAIARADSDLL